MGAVFAPVDHGSDLVESLNRTIHRDAGSSGYGQRIIWAGYDGVEKDPHGGATLSTGNPTLKIKNSSGYAVQIRKGDDSADLMTIANALVWVNTAFTAVGAATLAALAATSAAISGNATVGGTLGVTGTSTLGVVNAGATAVTTLSTSGLATLASASVTGTLGVTGTSTLGVANAGATAVSTLSTSGLATLNSASVTGNATVGGTLGVTGTSNLGTLNAGGTVVSSLVVSGATTVEGLEINGELNHDGSTIGFFGASPTVKRTISGSRGGNAALADLLTELDAYGFITDSTSA